MIYKWVRGMLNMKNEMKFYDLKAKESFATTDFTIEAKVTTKGTKYLARTTRESGQKCCKIVNKATYEAFVASK